MYFLMYMTFRKENHNILIVFRSRLLFTGSNVMLITIHSTHVTMFYVKSPCAQKYFGYYLPGFRSVNIFVKRMFLCQQYYTYNNDCDHNMT